MLPDSGRRNTCATGRIRFSTGCSIWAVWRNSAAPAAFVGFSTAYVLWIVHNTPKSVRLGLANPDPRVNIVETAMIRIARYLWALPTTAIGLLFVPLALISGGRVQVVDGVLEVYGGLCAWILRRCTLLRGGASAMTLGHVVLGRDRLCLEFTRSHERVHVRQTERWGPLFIPAYLVASAWAWTRGEHPYRDNCFEREAYALQ